MASERDFGDFLDTLLSDDAELASEVRSEELSARIARLVYQAREAAGLTQSELAGRMGSHQSSVARIEDEGYRGHSLTTLKKIADALGLQIDIQFSPVADFTSGFELEQVSYDATPVDICWESRTTGEYTVSTAA